MTGSIVDALSAVEDPALGEDIVSLGLVGRVERRGETAHVELALGAPYSPAETELLVSVRERIRQAGYQPEVTIAIDDGTSTGRTDAPPLLAFGSGKGGVGTSTVAVNVAVAMAGRGARVGLLDADIHGPSLAHMTGAASGSLPSTLGETVAPIDGHDLQLASVEFRAEGRPPLARADAARAVVGDLWEALAWADRDYVVVDLPSGVGEAQLTVLERLPVAGAVVVTTPQEVAVANARETIARCRDCGVPVLGVVENMRTFVCPDCDGVHDEFDTPDSELLAAEFDAPLLKQLPLEPSVRERGGRPVVLDDSGLVAGKLSQLARAVMDRLGETRRRAHADRTE